MFLRGLVRYVLHLGDERPQLVVVASKVPMQVAQVIGRERDALAARRCITTRSSVALDGRRLPKEAVGVCQRGVPVLEQPTS